MVDTKMAGAGWVELPPGTYRVRPEDQHSSHCQIEVDIKYAESMRMRKSTAYDPVLTPPTSCGSTLSEQVDRHCVAVHRRRVVAARAAAHPQLWYVACTDAR